MPVYTNYFVGITFEEFSSGMHGWVKLEELFLCNLH